MVHPRHSRVGGPRSLGLWRFHLWQGSQREWRMGGAAADRHPGGDAAAVDLPARTVARLAGAAAARPWRCHVFLRGSPRHHLSFAQGRHRTHHRGGARGLAARRLGRPCHLHTAGAHQLRCGRAGAQTLVEKVAPPRLCRGGAGLRPLGAVGIRSDNRLYPFGHPGADSRRSVSSSRCASDWLRG